MHIFVAILALGFLVLGIITNQKSIVENKWESQNQGNVLSEETEEEIDKQKDLSEVGEYEITNEKNTLSPSNTPTPTNSINKDNLFFYHYPNTYVVFKNEMELQMESFDNTDIITDWYKAKIEEDNLTAKTFVKTSANDNILNKLVGANSKKEVSIEINKSPGDSKVSIKVILDIYN